MAIFDIVPKKSAILVIGPPRSEKVIFADQFVIDGLMKDESAVYLVTNNFPEDVVNNMLPFVDKRIMNMRLVDCYSIHAGVTKSDEKYVIRTSGPYALNEISIAITKALNDCKPPIRVVFNSLSTLLLHNKIGQIEEFLEINIGKLKAKNSTILFVVEEGVHDEKVMSLLSSLTDATIKFNKEERSIRVTKVGEDKKIKYKLDKNKIVAGRSL